MSADLLPGMPAAPRDQPAVPVPVVRDAAISSCGQYRYQLFRRWSGGPAATWICLNPSVADHQIEDPTLRRIMQFSRAFGCGACTVTNVYALRATDPAELWRAGDPVGPCNDDHLVHVARYADDIGGPLIAAWGALAKPERIAAVLALPGMGRLTALATTKNGAPKHPLYLPGNLTPKPWSQP